MIFKNIDGLDHCLGKKISLPYGCFASFCGWTIERPFALALNENPEVKMLSKIPNRFKIETLIGAYNPDWAVYMDRNGEQKMYFVLETKGTLDTNQRRGEENQKIYCGRQHFKSLDGSVGFLVAKNWNESKVKN